MTRMRIDAALPDLMGINDEGCLEMLMDMTCAPASVVLAVSRKWNGVSDPGHALYSVEFVTGGLHVVRNHWCRLWWPKNGRLYLNIAPFEPCVGSGAVLIGRVLSYPRLDSLPTVQRTDASHSESCGRSIYIILELR